MSNAAQTLRSECAAVRLSFTWFGTRKSLSAQQKDEAAEPFHADGEALSASKRIIDTKNPAYKGVTAVKGQARDYWKAMSLPFPEAGIRLIRRSEIASFDAHMRRYKEDLTAAVRDLESRYFELREAARTQLGSLYNEADYPATLIGLFDLEWDFPSVEPPNYLMELNPALYEQERQRVQARFEVAISMAEQNFAEEMAKMVTHLAEKLSDGPEGRKTFRNSAIENLTDFFERFKKISVRSNGQLDALVEQAQKLVSGVTPKDLRDGAALRAEIAAGMQKIGEQIEAQIVTAPRRRIMAMPGAAPITAPEPQPAEAVPA